MIVINVKEVFLFNRMGKVLWLFVLFLIWLWILLVILIKLIVIIIGIFN